MSSLLQKKSPLNRIINSIKESFKRMLKAKEKKRLLPPFRIR
jgi:hypothetical protein